MSAIRTLQSIYGLSLVLFGLNGFFAFLPLPEKHGFALEFFSALHHSRYIFPSVAGIMTTAGVLLITNKWTALALLIQLPVSFNIFAFHLFHDTDGIVISWAIIALNLFFISKRFDKLKLIFNA